MGALFRRRHGGQRVPLTGTGQLVATGNCEDYAANRHAREGCGRQQDVWSGKDSVQRELTAGRTQPFLADDLSTTPG